MALPKRLAVPLSKVAQITAILVWAGLLATLSVKPASSVAGGRRLSDSFRSDVDELETVALPATPAGGGNEIVTIDLSSYRWFLWPGILYLFWGMAFVCDEYFVRTIDVISDKYSIPDDVAGATLMALGCNGPEMALNTINIFSPSNIGVGAVVGGEVFNVLVIIGTAVLATPEMYLPVKLGRFCFFRDVAFYMLSVVMLYWVLRDGLVTRFNALVLLFGAICYTLTVTFSSHISSWFNKEMKFVRSASRRISQRRFSLARKFTFGRGKDDQACEDSDSDDSEADPETVGAWTEALQNREPEKGSVLVVRVDMRNRLMDRNHRIDKRYLWLRDDAIIVSTVVDPVGDVKILQRGTSGIVYDHDNKSRENHWHHGGLVNQPAFFDSQPVHDSNDQGVHSLGGDSKTCPLLGEVSRIRSESQNGNGDANPPLINVPGFRNTPWEVIPLDDVLYCERAADDEKHFDLHVHQHDSNLGRLITLELSSKDEKLVDAWFHAIRKKLLDQRRNTTEAPPVKDILSLMMEWVGWLQFPVKFWVARTIPDMDDPKQQHLYPISFIMCMVWLAIFAFSVVKACDAIHDAFGISTDILGFTVAAAGTSFPNVFSGMCVAKQGKTSMAVANALGANVQNVFLALAVPWTIQSVCIKGGPFPMAVDNLRPALIECGITLLPVVLVYIFSSYSMPRWSGWLFLLTYVVYLIFAMGQQVNSCPTWPLWCQ